ncbi:uncharacterized protein NMK_1055 [Novimethylophilus kurashikiensis]|uniref:Coenzyme Q-binding protein COQ10 START domain-containing protein n=2 Tax=Novimethylophilus kurashikiensis TaxID=1825523 RepID=A0A2R5F5T3_9PROT|nr:uncharacterized protein NMK_1055 [Novimethylophilus kurashikiensis]
MSTVDKTIEVNVPVQVAYNQWTQFEDFPAFMEGITEVRQLDNTHLHWRADIAGKETEWDAEITEQVPDRRIAWHSTSGATNDGMVSFESAGTDKTRVMLHLDYDPQGFVENIGDALGMVSRRVEGDLRRYKALLESRGSETGAWRGRV